MRTAQAPPSRAAEESGEPPLPAQGVDLAQQLPAQSQAILLQLSGSRILSYGLRQLVWQQEAQQVGALCVWWWWEGVNCRGSNCMVIDNG